MSSDKSSRALVAIEYHISLIRDFTKDMDFEAFAADVRTQYAVTRCLEIISEASRKLSAEIKARHPDVQWMQIAGAGNVYRHDYEDVKAQAIWKTVSAEINALERAVSTEIAR
jgi:uncharacterized protein with HEPN domain